MALNPRLYLISYYIILNISIYIYTHYVQYICIYIHNIIYIIYTYKYIYIYIHVIFIRSSVPVLATSGASGKRLTGEAPGPCSEKPCVPRSRWRHSEVSDSSGSKPGGSTWRDVEDVEDYTHRIHVCYIWYHLPSIYPQC